jgi:hypothetical protein
VDDRAGVAGLVAAGATAKAQPDEYTLPLAEQLTHDSVGAVWKQEMGE